MDESENSEKLSGICGKLSRVYRESCAARDALMAELEFVDEATARRIKDVVYGGTYKLYQGTFSAAQGFDRLSALLQVERENPLRKCAEGEAALLNDILASDYDFPGIEGD